MELIYGPYTVDCRDRHRPGSGTRNPENFKRKPGTQPETRIPKFQTRNQARKNFLDPKPKFPSRVENPDDPENFSILTQFLIMRAKTENIQTPPHEASFLKKLRTYRSYSKKLKVYGPLLFVLKYIGPHMVSHLIGARFPLM